MVVNGQNKIIRKRWSEKEVEFLVKNYNKLTANQIASILGRTIWSIYHKARRIGLSSRIVGRKPFK